jgi:hypothetical protein
MKLRNDSSIGILADTEGKFTRQEVPTHSYDVKVEALGDETKLKYNFVVSSRY